LIGDVRIKRSGVEEWEKATLNLPVVEGDELATEADARVELQFDIRSHVWIGPNSSIKVTTLIREGIALSLSLGRLNVQLTRFDPDAAYFEIDTPGTTVALQRSGIYRLDAGVTGEREFRIAVNDGGEARVYTENSGFTVKNNRSATITVGGPNAGEADHGVASAFLDEFDLWTSERRDIIAESLRRAHYDKYYDQDIYGADELNDFGEWVYSSDYGYVWKPYRSSVTGYANWSPYRYGQWRWIPPYGWTWINDEPWGWSTYHYGRWFFSNGQWYWTPYGYYRSNRSWWSPALVIFTTYAGNYCWYPLPYGYAYYNYNYYYFNNHHGGHGSGNNHGGNPTPSPTPDQRIAKVRRPPIEAVPPTGVISVKPEKFGTKAGSAAVMDVTLAKAVLSRQPVEKDTAPILPEYKQIRSTIVREIKAEKPTVAVRADTLRTGAKIRSNNAPLDAELRNTRIFGGRTPAAVIEPVREAPGTTPTVRPTGVIVRPAERTPPAVKQVPAYTPPTRESEPVRQPPPVYQPPPVKETPRYTPPKTETPRYEPPVYQPPPTRQPPRSDPPPVRETPKPQPKPDPPPAKDGSVDRKKDGK
jgi:hypothetical protein